ncbi:MAG: hypothetical protein K2X45_07930 [Phreatobacter sp.]|nr:hypothetical protein [Phreatobacter sp.]
MTRAKTPIYPDQTLEKAAIAAGALVQPLWQRTGPPGTGVVWMEGLLINGHLIIVQTFEDGFQAFGTIGDKNGTDKTVEAVFAHCGLKTESAVSDSV